MKAKTIAIAVMAFLLAATLTSCTKPSYMKGFKESADFDDSLLVKSQFSSNMLITADYMKSAPLNKWNENAVKTAMKTNTLRIYFMSATAKAQSPFWGDCSIIVFPNGQVMVVDTGYKGFGEHLERNLYTLGIEKIDYLVITHNHDDHAFGLVYCEEILDNFNVGTVYWNGYLNTTSDEWNDKEALQHICANHNVPLQMLSKGDELMIGETKMTVLFPTADIQGQEDISGGMNKASIVFRLDFKDTSALFTGDTEPASYYSVYETLKAEGKLDLLDCDIIKCPHHGIIGNNPQDFINAVSPEYAFCMGNAPMDPTVYQKYARVGTRVYLENLDGYVRFVLDGSNITADASQERKVNSYAAYDKIAEAMRNKAN